MAACRASDAAATATKKAVPPITEITMLLLLMLILLLDPKNLPTYSLRFVKGLGRNHGRAYTCHLCLWTFALSMFAEAFFPFIPKPDIHDSEP